MALAGNEYLIRNGLVITGVDELSSDPGKYISIDADSKVIYRTNASVLSDITSGLTVGYIPKRSSMTLVNSNIYIDNTKAGVNTASPDGTFHIMTGSAGSVAANSLANDLVVESNDDGGISILVPDDGIGSLYFGNASSNYGASVKWTKSSKIFALGTNLTEAKVYIYSGAGVSGILLDENQDITFEGANYQEAGLLQTDINGKISVKPYYEKGSNYDLTITTPKSVASNTWETIPFELPPILGQNIQDQYDAGTKAFRVVDGETWLFNLNLSIAPTIDAQYIEAQIYDNTTATVVAAAVLVNNGTDYYQSLALSGIVYGEGTTRSLIFRVKSNRDFSVRPDTVNSSSKGTFLVATKQGVY